MRARTNNGNPQAGAATTTMSTSIGHRFSASTRKQEHVPRFTIRELVLYTESQEGYFSFKFAHIKSVSPSFSFSHHLNCSVHRDRAETTVRVRGEEVFARNAIVILQPLEKTGKFLVKEKRRKTFRQKKDLRARSEIRNLALNPRPPPSWYSM